MSECGHTLPARVSLTHGNESLFLYTPHTRCKHQVVIIFCYFSVVRQETQNVFKAKHPIDKDASTTKVNSPSHIES